MNFREVAGRFCIRNCEGKIKRNSRFATIPVTHCLHTGFSAVRETNKRNDDSILAPSVENISDVPQVMSLSICVHLYFANRAPTRLACRTMTQVSLDRASANHAGRGERA